MNALLTLLVDLPLYISSTKATLSNRNIVGSCWNLRELHGYENRWNHARIYKKGKRVRHANKYDLAEAINYAPAGYEPEEIKDFHHEWEEAYLEANLICGCEVTILKDGSEFVNRCTSARCHRRVLPY